MHLFFSVPPILSKCIFLLFFFHFFHFFISFFLPANITSTSLLFSQDLLKYNPLLFSSCTLLFQYHHALISSPVFPISVLNKTLLKQA